MYKKREDETLKRPDVAFGSIFKANERAVDLTAEVRMRRTIETWECRSYGKGGEFNVRVRITRDFESLSPRNTLHARLSMREGILVKLGIACLQVKI